MAHDPQFGHPSRVDGAQVASQLRPRRTLRSSFTTPTAAAVAGDALRMIRYPWQRLLPEWSMRFLAQQPGYLGRTIWPDRIIEIYVRPGQHVRHVAFAVAHELGHAIDLEHLDPASRAQWRLERQLHNRLDWFGASDADDFATPAGDWAECFAAWQLGSTEFKSLLGDAPTAEHCALLARLCETNLIPSIEESAEKGQFTHFMPEADVLAARLIRKR